MTMYSWAEHLFFGCMFTVLMPSQMHWRTAWNDDYGAADQGLSPTYGQPDRSKECFNVWRRYDGNFQQIQVGVRWTHATIVSHWKWSLPHQFCRSLIGKRSYRYNVKYARICRHPSRRHALRMGRRTDAVVGGATNWKLSSDFTIYTHVNLMKIQYFFFHILRQNLNSPLIHQLIENYR